MAAEFKKIAEDFANTAVMRVAAFIHWTPDIFSPQGDWRVELTASILLTRAQFHERQSRDDGGREADSQFVKNSVLQGVSRGASRDPET